MIAVPGSPLPGGSAAPVAAASPSAGSDRGGQESPTDEWYAKWGGGSGRDFVNVEVRMPTRVEMLVATFGSTGLLLATLRIGGVSFVHEVEDMRLLLRSAMEQLDDAIEYAQAPAVSP